MGGIGGALYAGFMLSKKEWAKIYNALMKNVGETKRINASYDYETSIELADEISSIIEENYGVKLNRFLRHEPGWGHEENDPTGLGVELMSGGGPDELTFEQMEENMNIKDTLRAIGKEYGLGEPLLYMIDVECY